MLGFEDVLPPVPKDASAGVDAAAQQLEATQLSNGPTTSPPQEDANGFFEQGGLQTCFPKLPGTFWGSSSPAHVPNWQTVLLHKYFSCFP